MQWQEFDWGKEGLTQIGEGGGEPKKRVTIKTKSAKWKSCYRSDAAGKESSYVIDKRSFSQEQKYDKLFLCWIFSPPNILLPVFLMVGILVIDLPLHKLFTNFLSVLCSFRLGEYPTPD